MCDHCSDALMQKNKAYGERNQLVALVSRIYPSWLEKHPSTDDKWENEWRNIVFIKFPVGSYSWHIHDSEMKFFNHLKFKEGNSWDGSSTEEKYEALRTFPVVQSFQLTMEKAKEMCLDAESKVFVEKCYG